MSKRILESEFVAILTREFPDIPSLWVARSAIRLINIGTRHHYLAEQYCNRELSEREREEYDEGVPKKLDKVNQEVFSGRLGFLLGGDPRGCTVKLTVPSGYVNDFVREGICVPGA